MASHTPDPAIPKGVFKVRQSASSEALTFHEPKVVLERLRLVASLGLADAALLAAETCSGEGSE